MENNQTRAVTQTEEVATEEKVTRFWWFLLILPLGILVGSITSTCNTLKHDMEKEDASKYVVSIQVNEKAVLDDLKKLYSNPPKTNQAMIRFLSSSITENPDQYLKQIGYAKVDGETMVAGYMDIKGEEEEKVIVLAVELDREHSMGTAALKTLTVAMIRSIKGEKDFRYTVRLVYLPQSATPEEHLTEIDKRILAKGESMQGLLLLRETDSYEEGQPEVWAELSGKGDLTERLKRGGMPEQGSYTVWTHPATLTDKVEGVSEARFDMILKAVSQLREAVLRVAK